MVSSLSAGLGASVFVLQPCLARVLLLPIDCYRSHCIDHLASEAATLKDKGASEPYVYSELNVWRPHWFLEGRLAMLCYGAEPASFVLR